jgi:hypothetical protein
MPDNQGITPLEIAEKVMKDPEVLKQYQNLLKIKEEKCAAMKPLLCQRPAL